MYWSWDGITLARSLNDSEAEVRHALADAAKCADWPRVFDLMSNDASLLVNSARLDSSSWYAPLHQAAWHGAPIDIVRYLVVEGAWRTLRNARGERAMDIAERRSHRHLLEALAPEYKHSVPMRVLLRIQTHFHEVIRGRSERLVKKQRLRLPELEPLLELDRPNMWFAVPGMYGGFSYRLESEGFNAKLICESWSRIVGGSGQRHEITTAGSQLVDVGFV